MRGLPALRATRLVARSLGVRRSRALLAVCGVALSTLLVAVQVAATRGVTSTVERYLGRPGFELWVAPRGIDNLLRASGTIDAELVEAVERTRGVAGVDRVLRQIVSLAPVQRGRAAQRMALAVGYRPPSGAAGPVALIAGRHPAGEGEVALDRAAAHSLGLRLDDELRVNGRRATIVGLTTGSNLLATQLVFFHVAAAEQAGALFGDTSFLALRVAPNIAPGALARALEARHPELSVYSRAEFLANSAREVSIGVKPLLAMIALLGVIVAGVLIALLLQSTVEDRRSELAVLAALGVRFSRVAAAVVLRALRLAASGVGLGLLAAWALGAWLDRYRPTIQLAFEARDLLLVSLVFCAGAALASFAPLLRVARVDPIEAFRS